jgi:broad specificity phosphatase PhoE
MKPNRIILIRHGESEGNVDNGVYERKPDYALELTENGKIQSNWVGKQLIQLIGNESAFFYISPMWRTRMTFEHIAKHYIAADTKRTNTNKFWLEEPRIREQEWGHFKNISQCIQIDTERDAYGSFYYRIPDGESVADVYDRVSDFMGTLHRDFKKAGFPQNAILVTHGMTIRVFLMRWLHWTVEEFEGYKNPENCQMVILQKNPNGKYSLRTNMQKKP